MLRKLTSHNKLDQAAGTILVDMNDSVRASLTLTLLEAL